jgi:type IV pilus assembly protein PilX
MKNQKGISLVIVLIFLTVLSLLGFAASRSAIVQEKLTGNDQDKQSSRMNAGETLRTVENMLVNGIIQLPTLGSSVSAPPVPSNPLGNVKPGTYVVKLATDTAGNPDNTGCSIGTKYVILATGYGVRSTTKTTLEEYVCFS